VLRRQIDLLYSICQLLVGVVHADELVGLCAVDAGVGNVRAGAGHGKVTRVETHANAKVTAVAAVKVPGDKQQKMSSTLERDSNSCSNLSLC
jgi:hypothetical protein